MQLSVLANTFWWGYKTHAQVFHNSFMTRVDLMHELMKISVSLTFVLLNIKKLLKVTVSLCD